MSVIDVDAKIANKFNPPVPSLEKQEQNEVCSAKHEATASDEALAAIAQHPLADLFGKYSGEVWEEIFAGLEQDRLDRQNRQDMPEEDTAASQE